MPRPRKPKIICSMPLYNEFGPREAPITGEPVILSVEEYETIRLIDHKGMDQSQCANELGVARSTVQRLYSDARTKIAKSIVTGKHLNISGGDYKLCPKRNNPALCEGCGRRRGRHRRGKP